MEGKRGEPIGIAVIGAGHRGPDLVRNARATPGLDLRDLDAEHARRVLGDHSTAAVSGSLDDVLADPEVAAVAIATPAATHLPVAMAALVAGKHVLVEEPLATTFADGLKLVEAAESRGLTLMLDHTSCYTPAVGRLRELVRGGELGEVQYIDSVRIDLGPVRPDVDARWDLAPHDLSILEAILPDDVRPVEVSTHGSDPVGACVAHLTMRLSNGSTAHVHMDWSSPAKIRTVVVGGSARTAVWDDLDPTRPLSVRDRGVDLGREQRIVPHRSGDVVAPEREALRGVLEEFAASITEGRPPLTDGRAGLRVLAILEAASESLAEDGAYVPVQRVGAPTAGGGATP